jgi:hypothetical protein
MTHTETLVDFAQFLPKEIWREWGIRQPVGFGMG